MTDQPPSDRTADLEARNRWVDFSRAKDAMLAATDIPEAPWWVVDAEEGASARARHRLEARHQLDHRDLAAAAPLPRGARKTRWRGRTS